MIEYQTFPIFTKDSVIEKADDSITLRNQTGGDEILFFRKWKVYVYKLDYLSQKIDVFLNTKKDKDRLQIDEDPIKSELFYKFFGCNYDFGANLRITANDFEETYLKKLVEPHDSGLWSKLIGKHTVYGKLLLSRFRFLPIRSNSLSSS